MADIVCSCRECVSRCEHVPGWMTPNEAERAMNAGLSSRLMLDFWVDVENVYVLTPRSVTCDDGGPLSTEQLYALGGNRCGFLTSDDKCEIHSSGFKPIECRTSAGCRAGVGEGKQTIHPLWRTPEARALIERWKAEVGYV